MMGMRFGPLVIALALVCVSHVGYAEGGSPELFCQSAPAPAPLAAPPASAPHWRDLEAVLLLSVAVAAALVAVHRKEERRLGARTAVSWTPYLAGIAAGVIFAISLLVYGRPLGVSAGVQQAARLVERARGWRESFDPRLMWPLWVLVGVTIGGVTSARWRGERPAARDGRATGSNLKSAAAAFGSGALLQIAATVAGGCTSGLALSGGIVLAPAAFLFMAGMFIGGIPAAWVAGIASHRRGRS